MVTQTEPFTAVTVHPLVNQYFQEFNGENYHAVACLFASEGVLRPPFEEGLVGPDAIRTYLAAEAKGMRATPLETEIEPLDGGERQITVKGKVKALVFTVNVQWTFILSADNKILDAHIKLLASLQELLHLNPADQTETRN